MAWLGRMLVHGLVWAHACPWPGLGACWSMACLGRMLVRGIYAYSTGSVAYMRACMHTRMDCKLNFNTKRSLAEAG
eukprot:357881-Chlamydomonas_euryale.AAC.8